MKLKMKVNFFLMKLKIKLNTKMELNEIKNN